MAYKLGIAGPPNTGKSYARKTMRKGENTFLLMPSNKATHIVDSSGKPLKPFNVKTDNISSIEQLMEKLNVTSIHKAIAVWNKKLKPGSFKREHLKGNVQLVQDLNDLPIWLEFISKHLPWIHTVIVPDFTHFISKIISTEEFINRKIGGEAYQRFWELAATALRNFILSIDNYREDLIVVTEYHAEADDATGKYDIFVPSGKMLTDKFKVPSYYDILLFTDVKMDDEDGDSNAEYRFVTKPTSKYPLARALNLFEETYIPNDLQYVLDNVRESLGIPLKDKEEQEAAAKSLTREAI